MFLDRDVWTISDFFLRGASKFLIFLGQGLHDLFSFIFLGENFTDLRCSFFVRFLVLQNISRYQSYHMQTPFSQHYLILLQMLISWV